MVDLFGVGVPISAAIAIPAVLLVLLVVLALVADRVGGISIPFALSAVVIVLVAFQTVTPGFYRAAFPGVLPALNSRVMLFYSAVIILLLWIAEVVVNEGRTDADKIAKGVGDEAEGLARTYGRITRYSFGALVSIVTVLLGFGGDMLGDLAGAAMDAPLIASNALGIGITYGALYRPVVPGINLSVFEVIAVMAVLFVVAMGVKYS